MDLLNDISDLLVKTPTIAIWIVAIIYLYKVSIVGSIYGVIRYVAFRITLVYEKRVELERERITLELEKSKAPTQFELTSSNNPFGKIIINTHADELLEFLKYMRTDKSSYVHGSDITYAFNALKERRYQDEQAKKDKLSKP